MHTRNAGFKGNRNEIGLKVLKQKQHITTPAEVKHCHEK